MCYIGVLLYSFLTSDWLKMDDGTGERFLRTGYFSSPIA